MVADMGTTTFDVAAVRADQIFVTPEVMIDEHDVPIVAIRAVGVGGTLAGANGGGLRHVGS
ncbi:hydantoinase/oxoprolinase family protein [Paracoccus aminophilus]|uniref:hydantoinase/oxoprolinase family protein n=1 Tax=Paracoccus aminophilus TaxID=34003 RepID=UPI0003F9D410